MSDLWWAAKVTVIVVAGTVVLGVYIAALVSAPLWAVPVLLAVGLFGCLYGIRRLEEER